VAKLASQRYKYDTQTLYRDLIGAGILRPVIRSAGSFNYFVQNQDKLDAIASSIDVDKTVSLLARIFGGGLPWKYRIPDYAYRGKWNAEKQAYDEVSKPVAASRAATDNVVYGEETWISDSYPRYAFPAPPPPPLRRWKPNHHRKWESNETFVSQTFYYVVEANLQTNSYICSSVRTPIVANLVSQLNDRFRSSVTACLNSVGAAAREKIRIVLDFLGDNAICFLSTPALFVVLQEAQSRSDTIPALFRLRQSEKASQFRSWCLRLQQAWERQDLNQILHHISEVDAVMGLLAQEGQVAHRTINHLGNLNLLIEDHLRVGCLTPGMLETDTFSPSLVFLKDVGVSLMQSGRNRQIIEDLLQHKFSNADVETATQLLSLREQQPT
jgi:hypothetical protein